MSQWIKCSEQMPGEHWDVLVTDGQDVAVGWFTTGDDWPRWYYYGRAVGGLETHWQPLPSPPEEA